LPVGYPQMYPQGVVDSTVSPWERKTLTPSICWGLVFFRMSSEVLQQGYGESGRETGADYN